jgi:hypothetical protein
MSQVQSRPIELTLQCDIKVTSEEGNFVWVMNGSWLDGEPDGVEITCVS